MNIQIRTLIEEDKVDWFRLWVRYQAFYRSTIPDSISELTWCRFADPAEPMVAFGAFAKSTLVGIVHAIYHRSTWTEGDYCYLQDLFADAACRGQGVGRALIEHVCEQARVRGASQIYWLTHESNAQAILLYDHVAERSGFLQYRMLL